MSQKLITRTFPRHSLTWRARPSTSGSEKSGGDSACGDGGSAVAARFDKVVNMAIDGRGNIYIADYWNHRVQHRTRLGWSNHVTHHSSQFYNLSTALRQPWTGVLMHWIFAPMLLAGYSPAQVARAGEINLLYHERRRVLLDLAEQPDPASSDAERLRVRARELAAGLDAWTGGGFSRALARSDLDPHPD